MSDANRPPPGTRRRTGRLRAHPRFQAPGAMLSVHRFLFIQHPLASLCAASGVYAFIVLAFGLHLEISSNYFVLLPVLASALGYGLAGGLAAGALGLPANLLLFAVLGRPDFSPASKPIAELSGLLVGGASGYLAEYFRQLQSEIARRSLVEDSLRAALEDKHLLLRELQHRVKNNLNVIKSLIQLQRNRSEDPRFREASDRLLARIFAMARAHDRMFGEDASSEVPLGDYFRDILAVYDTEAGDGHPGTRIEADIEAGDRALPSDVAVPLGLILNEAVSNAWKHGSGPGDALIRVRFAPEGGSWVLEVRDEGPGFDAGGERPGGLGMKIIRSLAVRLRGRVEWIADGGTRFRLTFRPPGAAPSEERGGSALYGDDPSRDPEVAGR